MRAYKLLPRGRLLALGSGRHAMTFEDVAYRLVADRVPKLLQGSDEAIVAPRAVLSRHLHHQLCQLRVDPRPSKELAVLGAVKPPGHQLAVPSQDRVWLDDAGHFCEGLLAELFADRSQRLAFGVRQADATGDLVT